MMVKILRSLYTKFTNIRSILFDKKMRGEWKWSEQVNG